MDDFEVAKDTVSVRRVLSHYGVDVDNRKNYSCPNPEHERGDKNPSLTVDPGDRLFNCFSCNKGGSIIDLVMMMGLPNESKALVFIQETFMHGEQINQQPRPVVKKKSKGEYWDYTPVMEYANKRLIADSVSDSSMAMRELKACGFSKDTIEGFKIGYHGSFIYIPYIVDGRCRRIKLINISDSPQGKKKIYTFPTKQHRRDPIMIDLMKDNPEFGKAGGNDPYNMPCLFNSSRGLSSDTVYIVAGEKDCMRACLAGIEAVSSANGERSWDTKLNALVKGKSVGICYDNDVSGKNGACKLASVLMPVAHDVRIMDISTVCTESGEDVYDFFEKYGKTREDFSNIYNSSEILESGTPDSIKAEVSHILASKELDDLEKTASLSNLTLNTLKEIGEFYMDNESEVRFFFHSHDKRIYEIHNDSGELKHLIRALTNIYPGHRSMKPILENVIWQEDIYTKVDVHRFSYYDNALGIVYIARNDNSMYMIKATGAIETVPLGTNSVMFHPQEVMGEGVQLDSPMTDISIGNLVYSIIDANFDIGTDMTLLDREELITVIFIWLLSIFFESIMPTKPILTYIGDHGSGKTTAQRKLGLLLIGDQFNVNSLKDKDVDTILTNRALIAFDQVDGDMYHMLDKLATIATGENIAMRSLYTTNDMITLKPKCFVCLSSISPKFTRNDIVDRLLLVPLGRPKKGFLEYSSLKALILNDRPQLLGVLFKLIQATLYGIQSPNNNNKTVSIRMADYGSFAIKALRGIQARYSGLNIPIKYDPTTIFTKLSKDQSTLTLDNDLFFQLLSEWMDMDVPEPAINASSWNAPAVRIPNNGRPVTIKQLHAELLDIVRGRPSEKRFFATPKTLLKKVKKSMGNLLSIMDVKVSNKQKPSIYTFLWVE